MSPHKIQINDANGWIFQEIEVFLRTVVSPTSNIFWSFTWGFLSGHFLHSSGIFLSSDTLKYLV